LDPSLNGSQTPEGPWGKVGMNEDSPEICAPDLPEALPNCSGLRTGTLGLANKGFVGPALCANTRPLGPTLIANGPVLLCKGLANTPVGQR
jgi:hypothetical protein